jgi:hypothetical protein
MTRKSKPEMFEKEQRMLQAIAAVKSKEFESAVAAAKHFDIAPSTLRHCINGRVSRRESLGKCQKVTPMGEEELVRWITQLTITRYSPSYDMVREMAEEIRTRYPLSTVASTVFTSNDKTSGPLGKE